MPPNVSSRYPCFWCIKTVKWIPVLFIVTIVVWSYYAYVIQLCLFTVENIAEKVAYLIVYHGFFAIFAWSYWQTIFTDIGQVPRRFQLSGADVEKLEKESEENQRKILERVANNLPVVCQTATKGVRYCEKCYHIKPDRAHHCSACGTCVLKMDHHCPWVNNCVAFTNYKFFVQFLGYALLYCIYIASTTLHYFIKFWRNELTQAGRFHILFLFFMAIMFAISLVSLFGYHLYLVSVNRTTLESFRAPIVNGRPDKDCFNLGRYNNFIQVFGEKKKYWFLPLFSSAGDGVEYPTRTPQANSYNSMGSTQTSMGEGVTYPRIVNKEADGLLNAEEGEAYGFALPEQGTINVNQSTSRSSFSSDVRLIVE